jgi:hypothetical protein
MRGTNFSFISTLNPANTEHIHRSPSALRIQRLVQPKKLALISIVRAEGFVTARDKLLCPANAGRGSIAITFENPSDSFTVTINSSPAFTPARYRWTHRPF